MIVLDANVLLEVLLDRHYKASVQHYLADVDEELAITTLSVHLIYHFADLADVDIGIVDNLVMAHTLLPVSDKEVTWAIKHREADMEDAQH